MGALRGLGLRITVSALIVNGVGDRGAAHAAHGRRAAVRTDELGS
jgi:hypothetical protein